MTGPGSHAGEYGFEATLACERALVTLLGNVGGWAQYLYLVGGLVPRYLIPTLPPEVAPHVGSLDVDLGLAIAIDDEGAYRTLLNELRGLDFKQAPPPDRVEFQWRADVDGQAVLVEFLCDDPDAPRGRNVRPRRSTGSAFQAFNVEGIRLAAADHVERRITAERIGGGQSTVDVRIPNLLPFSVLKVLAFNDRHKNKDAYDLVYCLFNHPGGPREAGAVAAASPVIADPLSEQALRMLRERFATEGHDGPVAYATFLGRDLDPDGRARLALESVAVVDEFLAALDEFLRRG